MHRHRPARQHHLRPRPREIIGPRATHLQRRINRRHLLDRPGKPRQHRLDLRARRAHVTLGNHLALQIERVGLRAEGHGKRIHLVAIKHPPGELGRLTQRDRQHSRRQRIERPAMPDLDPALADVEPGLPQRALDRRHALRRAQPERLVEDQPAMHAAHKPPSCAIPRKNPNTALAIGPIKRRTMSSCGLIIGSTNNRISSSGKPNRASLA